MPEYLLVESRDPRDSAVAGAFLADAARLAESGHRVLVHLIQDGVHAAARSAGTDLVGLIEGGVEVRIDQLSLTRRALSSAELVHGVTVTGIDELARHLLADGIRVVWH
jgi:predicted peroxiredoxin